MCYFTAFFWIVTSFCVTFSALGRRQEEGGRRKEEGGRRKEEGGRRKEEGGRRKEEGMGGEIVRKSVLISVFSCF